MEINRSATHLIISILIIFCLQLDSIAQTSAYGNYRIYTAETSTSSFGYLSTNLKFPEGTGIGSVNINGVMYIYNYLFTNLTSMALSHEDQIKFYLEGAFRIGAGIGSKSLSFIPPTFKSNDATYYYGTIDIFSLEFTPEYTRVFNHGEAISFKFGINFLNIGASGALLKDGKFDQHSIIEVNLIPFALRPTLFYDFGKTGIGISYFVNATNILSYVAAKKELFGSERGFRSFSRQFSRHSFQIVFIF